MVYYTTLYRCTLYGEWTVLCVCTCTLYSVCTLLSRISYKLYGISICMWLCMLKRLMAATMTLEVGSKCSGKMLRKSILKTSWARGTPKHMIRIHRKPICYHYSYYEVKLLGDRHIEKASSCHLCIHQYCCHVPQIHRVHFIINIYYFDTTGKHTDPCQHWISYLFMFNVHVTKDCSKLLHPGFCTYLHCHFQQAIPQAMFTVKFDLKLPMNLNSLRLKCCDPLNDATE